MPTKFNIDKRKIHLSNLILTNQLSREAALLELDKPPYPSENELQKDINFFLKKMKWSREHLDEYLNATPVPHTRYRNSTKYTDLLIRLKRKALTF